MAEKRLQCVYCDRFEPEVLNVFSGPEGPICNECLIAGELSNFQSLEIMVKSQFRETGQVSPWVLDQLIVERGINLEGYQDQVLARELWHNLILISIIDPSTYDKLTEQLSNKAKMLKNGDDIPDIPA